MSLINFSSLRYSLPIFFSFYIFIFQLYIFFIPNVSFSKTTVFYLFAYVVLSVVFYSLFDFTFMEIGERFNGFTGSPTTYAAIMAIIYILADRYLNHNFYTRLLLYLVIFILVLLSKTRLVLLFMIVYPVLFYIINKKAYSYSVVFVGTFLVLYFVYPIYTIIADIFPELITMRYDDNRDASFGLRIYLYNILQTDFLNGSIWEMLFGKGNEYSRLLVYERFSQDLFPHNDFIRIIIDWGIIGGGAFFYFLYRLSKRNLTALFISILYLILFYSNMIFNLYIISILIIISLEQKTKLR